MSLASYAGYVVDVIGSIEFMLLKCIVIFFPSDVIRSNVNIVTVTAVGCEMGYSSRVSIFQGFKFLKREF